MKSSKALWLVAILAAGWTAAQAQTPQAPAPPNDAEVRELQQRIDSLSKQLDELERAKDTSKQQGLMEENWRDMQDYMGWMHSRWGAGSPWMMGPGMMQGGDWMGCPAMGGGGAAWSPPAGMTPEQYGPKMSDHLRRMHEQMNQIAQTTDPKERQRLLQEHWQTMYRDMQGMRGMGWMWGGHMMGPGMMNAPGPGSSSALPDASSAGAKLVSDYCTQYHAAPPPTLHTSPEWAAVVGRMNLHIVDTQPGIRAPSTDQMQTILAYMQTHAR